MMTVNCSSRLTELGQHAQDAKQAQEASYAMQDPSLAEYGSLGLEKKFVQREPERDCVQRVASSFQVLSCVYGYAVIPRAINGLGCLRFFVRKFAGPVFAVDVPRPHLPVILLGVR